MKAQWRTSVPAPMMQGAPRKAVEDGATRPVYYESRVIKLHLKPEILQLIDAEYDLMAQNADPEVIEKSKKQLGQMETILSDDDTISTALHQYLVNSAIGDWFTITNKNDASDYITLAAANLEQLREAVNKRMRPTRTNVV